ncbi:T-cell immunomodulatory protein [Chionoecetes opilio]|uniref:T-cell immunomodulatory protein n=1 Tax=Chionoecetes opilio TaxID=41210 RepID=A0A8J5BVD0_CHIOP|nr:T-cell immunomodulatory protein [Chionoecetes opilio]
MYGLKLLTIVVTVTQSWGLNFTEYVFGTNTNFLPAAFGDFNSDKLTDLFVVTEDGKTVAVLMSQLEPPLMLAPGPEGGPNCTYKSIKIHNVAPGDFDGNGAMDVMIVSYNATIKSYQVYILWGNSEALNADGKTLKKMTLECGSEDMPLLTLSGQPLVMDYNGDMIPDLFGEDANKTRMFWVFGPKRDPPQAVPVNVGNLTDLRLPSSHAFVDLDDDLAADLWVTAKGQYEVWMKSNEGFKLQRTIKLPAVVNGQTSFADVNLDGEVDALVPACKDSGCAQSAVFIYSYGHTKWIELDINFKDSSENTWKYPYQSLPDYRYTDTITLHVGDYNLDGYPDFLVTLINTQGKPRVTLMENVKCDQTCNVYPRKFVPKWNLFEKFGDTVLGTFCDFQEDGTLDILLVRKDSEGKYQLGVYKDPTEYDAVFVKVLIPTGRCYGSDCQYKNIPYGTNQPGPSITYTITTATGGLQCSRATQLSQTAHYALQLPYTVFGLGRNWNFVEELKVGVPKGNNTKTLSSSFTQIIPNSQLIVIPYPMQHPDRWVSKLFITPSKAMLMTGGALVGTCLFVAIIIGILHRREMKQDKKEKQQDSHKFHFDAM